MHGAKQIAVGRSTDQTAPDVGSLEPKGRTRELRSPDRVDGEAWVPIHLAAPSGGSVRARLTTGAARRSKKHQPAIPFLKKAAWMNGDQEELSVDNIGVFNGAQGAEAFGFRDLERVYWNLEAPALYEQSIARGEARLAKGGALLAETGIHTGRSPKDKFVVRDARPRTPSGGTTTARSRPSSSTRSWPTSWRMPSGKELFAQDLYGGADPSYRVRARVFTEFAWHSLFIRNLLIRPERESSTVSRRSSRSSTCPRSRPIRRAMAAAAKRSSPAISPARSC